MKKILTIAAIVLFFTTTLTLVTGLKIAGAATVINKWANVKGSYPGSTVGHSVNPSGMNAGGVVWSRHNLSSYGPYFKPIKESTEITVVLVDPEDEDNCTHFDPNPPYWLVEFWSCAYDVTTLGTTQICVFCHTSHHSTSATGPLWNKENKASYITYSKYGSGTIAGTNTAVSGSSLACLSCHDGVTTFDSMINSPGSGSNTDGSATDLGWSWYMWTEPLAGADADKTMDHFSASDCGLCHDQEVSDRLNIGQGPGFSYTPPAEEGGFGSGVASLTDDHPIGVEYLTDGRASLRPIGTTIADVTMWQAKSLVEGENTDIGRSDNYWSIFGYINSSATIQDLLRGGKVECTSCHDPHFKNQTNNEPAVINSYNRTGYGDEWQYTVSGPYDPAIDGLFFRRVGGNSNSGVCRTCHNK